MEVVATDALINIIRDINGFGNEVVLFVVKDAQWKCLSKCFAYSFNLDEDVPLIIDEAVYFLEAELVKDVIEVWKDWNSVQYASLEKLVDAVIYYAENDASKPVEGS